MPKITYIAPMARPPAEGWPILVDAHRRGYGIAIFLDEMNEYAALMKAARMPAIILTPSDGVYPGYPLAMNTLAAQVFHHDPECNWVLCGSDDIYVDQNWHPDHIALQLEAHFGGTFGVCQPTGDPFEDARGKIIDRIAGSPICGREFCRRVNQGNGGPFYPGFKHMWCDNALMETAKRLGVYLQRPDLTQEHRHFTRVGDKATWTGKEVPSHLKQWNTPEHWDWSKKLYDQLAALDFAPCMPIPE